MEILIVKTSAIGDVVQAFSTLNYLLKKFPHAKIDWVVEKSASALVLFHPQIRETLILDTKSWRKNLFGKTTHEEMRLFTKQLRSKRYDLLIDLQGNCKSALVALLARAKAKVGFSWKSLAEKPNYLATTHRYFPPDHLSSRAKNLFLAQSFFNDFSTLVPTTLDLKISPEEQSRLKAILSTLSTPRLMVCAGSKWKNKQLGEETLLALLKMIYGKFVPTFLFIWSNEDEKKSADRLAAHFPGSITLGDLSLNLWQALMARVEGVLAVDSSALHLCGTTKTPSFSIFGPSSSSFYKPEGKRHVAVQGSCPYGKTFHKRCPILRTCTTGACIRALKAEDLFEQFKRWWTL